MWHGSLGVVKAIRTGDALKCFCPLELDNEPGVCAWMFNARLHQRRYGANAYPMPGVASIFVAINGSIYVQVSPLAPVLGKGIATSDCEAHYETSDGPGYILNATATVSLKQDHVVCFL